MNPRYQAGSADTTGKYLIPLRDPFLYGVLTLSFFSFTLIGIRILILGNYTYPPLFKNLLIAWVPLALTLSVQVLGRFFPMKRLKPYVWAISPVWLLFLPNAPYLLTDYVHIFANGSFEDYPLERFILWYDMILFFVYSLFGLLAWFLSLWHVQTMVLRKFGPVAGWGVAVAGTFFSGVGVFIGRIARLNSWEAVTNPVGVVQFLDRLFSLQCLSFVIFFGFFLLIIYLNFFMISGRAKTVA